MGSDTLSSPRDRESIERTMRGFEAGLRSLSIPQLMDLAARQAALLQEQANRRISDTLSAYLERNLDSPVQRSEPTASLSPQPPDRPAPASRSSRPPSPADLRSSRERVGRRIVAGLARSGQSANARRARTEGRR